MADVPVFPITVSFEEDHSKSVFESLDEAAENLEWFDSEDPEERAVVSDSQGRRVVLKVEKLKVLIFVLAP